MYVASSLLRKVSSKRSVRVTSIPALLKSLANNSIDEIVVANGTYHVSPSGQLNSDSLWIGGDRFASRTRPITVRAETIGGVTLDGSGNSGAYGGLSFEDGAHDQTWDGFRFANMKAEYTGIIEVGGYLPRRPPHNITIRNMKITASCTGRATTADGRTWDHGSTSPTPPAGARTTSGSGISRSTAEATSPAPSTSITAMLPTRRPGT